MKRRKCNFKVKYAVVCALVVGLLASMTVFFTANAAEGDPVSPTDEIVAVTDDDSVTDPDADGIEDTDTDAVVESTDPVTETETDTNPYGTPAITIVTNKKQGDTIGFFITGNGEVRVDTGGNKVEYTLAFDENDRGRFSFTVKGSVLRFYGDIIGLVIEPEENWVDGKAVYSNTGVTSIDVSNAENLIDLSCQYGMLKSIDVSSCTELKSLRVGHNQLTSLDVSHNPELYSLICNGNAITSLNLSQNTRLSELECSGNRMTSLVLPQPASMTVIDCSDNQLTTLNIENHNGLESLSCGNNNISSLALAGKTQLKRLYCGGNKLNELDLSACDDLLELDCSNNRLEALNVSEMPDLYILRCNNNALRYSSIQLNPDAVYGVSHEEWEDYQWNAYWEISFSGQKTIAIPDFVANGDEIDLSDEFDRLGTFTEFVWRDENGNVVTPASSESGVFTFGEDAVGKTLYCTMTNARYMDRVVTDWPSYDDFDNWEDYYRATDELNAKAEEYNWSDILPTESHMFTTKIKVIQNTAEEFTLPGERTLKMGMSLNLANELRKPESMTKITWSTSNGKIVSVNKNGFIKALAAGKAVITAKCGTQKATCTVVVEKAVVLNKYELTLVRNNSKPMPSTYISGKKPSGVKNIVWKSDNPLVVSVDSKGKLTALSEGTATITCDDVNGGAMSAPCTVTVKDFFITGSEDCMIGNTAYVLANDVINFELIGGEDQQLVWKTSNAKIAAMLEPGQFLGKVKGVVNISVQTADRKYLDVIKLIVVQPTETLTIRNKSVTMYAGSSVALKAVVAKNSYDPIFWTSANEKIATVDAKGNVKAVSQGETTITATTFSGATDTATVSVRSKAVSLAWFVDHANMVVSKQVKYGITAGSSFNLSFDITSPANCNDTSVWSTSNKKVVTVEPIEDGKTATIRGIAKGTAIITVKTGSGKTITTKVTVVTKPAQQITLNKTSFEVYKGAAVTLTAKTAPRGNDDVVLWKSNDPWYASVDENGVVRGLQTGETDIIAYSSMSGEVCASAHVLVRSKATQIAWINPYPRWDDMNPWEVSDSDMTISKQYVTSVRPGETTTVSFNIIEPRNCNDTVTWSTSDKRIATVASTGSVEMDEFGFFPTERSAVITGIKKGTVTITAKTGSGKKLIAKVNVVDVPASEIVMGKEIYSVYVGNTVSLSAKVLPKGSNDAILWRSTDPLCATVDENGRVKGLQHGVAKIIAYSATDNNVKSIAYVAVRTKATGIKASVSSINLDMGDYAEFSVSLTPYYSSDYVTAVSSDKRIVTVEKVYEDSIYNDCYSFAVRGVKVGTAYVTVKTGSGKSVKIKVVVKKVVYDPNQLTVWGSEVDNQFLNQASRQWVEAYNNAHPGNAPLRVKVKIVGEDIAPSELMNNPDSQVNADVLGVTSDMIYDLASRNLIAELPEDVVGQLQSDVDSVLMSSVYSDGKHYGMPYCSNVGQVLYYDKRVYTEEEAGNLNTMLEKDLGGGKVNLCAQITSPWDAMVWFSTAGAELYTNGDRSVNTLNSADSVKMLCWLKQQISDNKIVNISDAEGCARVMGDGMVGACICGPWAVGYFKEAVGKENLGIVELPYVTVPDSGINNKHLSCFNASKAFVMNARTTHPEASLSLMQYLMSDEAQLLRYSLTGAVPTSASLAENEAIMSDPIACATIAQNNYSIVSRPENNISNYWAEIGDFMTEFLDNEMTAETIQSNLDAIVGRMQQRVM